MSEFFCQTCECDLTDHYDQDELELGMWEECPTCLKKIPVTDDSVPSHVIAIKNAKEGKDESSWISKIRF